MKQPYRPLSAGGLGATVSVRQRGLGQVLRRYGPHGLRHAGATYLLAEGFTLKQITDHLGHTMVRATEIYAKVDVAALRQVSDIDLSPWRRMSGAARRDPHRSSTSVISQPYHDTFRLLIPFATNVHATTADRLAVADVSAELARRFLRHVEEQHLCGVRTRNQRLAAIHAFATFIGERCPELIP